MKLTAKTVDDDPASSGPTQGEGHTHTHTYTHTHIHTHTHTHTHTLFDKLIKLIIVEPRYSEGPRDWQNTVKLVLIGHLY